LAIDAATSESFFRTTTTALEWGGIVWYGKAYHAEERY